MNFQQYISFCSDYDVFPDFTTKANDSTNKCSSMNSTMTAYCYLVGELTFENYENFEVICDLMFEF